MGTAKGAVNWADLSKLIMVSGKSILQNVNFPDGSTAIVVGAADHAPVDFMGRTWCGRPRSGRGLTLALCEPIDAARTFPSFVCMAWSNNWHGRNPPAPAAPGEQQLALLCICERDLASLSSRSHREESTLPSVWSDTKLADTPFVSASGFGSSSDADLFCARSVGSQKQAVGWPAGGIGQRLAGTSGGRAFKVLNRIDKRGALRGYCLARG